MSVLYFCFRSQTEPRGHKLRSIQRGEPRKRGGSSSERLGVKGAGGADYRAAAGCRKTDHFVSLGGAPGEPNATRQAVRFEPRGEHGDRQRHLCHPLAPLGSQTQTVVPCGDRHVLRQV